MNLAEATMQYILGKVAVSPEVLNVTKLTNLKENAAAFKELGSKKDNIEGLFRKIHARIESWKRLDYLEPENPEAFDPVISDEDVEIIKLMSREGSLKNAVGEYVETDDAEGNRVLALKRKAGLFKCEPLVLESRRRGGFGSAYSKVETLDDLFDQLEELNAADISQLRHWIFAVVDAEPMPEPEPEPEPVTKRTRAF